LSSRPLPTLNKGVRNESDDDDDDYEEEMAGYVPVTDSTRADGDPYPLVDPSEAERDSRTGSYGRSNGSYFLIIALAYI